MDQVIKISLPTPFKVGPVNVYVIKGETLTLVDAGPKTDEAWAVLVEELGRSGLKVKEIDQILLTHHHVDHVGLVNRILQEKDVPVLAHPQAVPYLQREDSFFSRRRQFFQEFYLNHGVPEELLPQVEEMQRFLMQFAERVRVDQTLENGQTLPGEPDWEVIHTPGHAPDHLSLYHRVSQWMIAGDHLIKHISSNAFVEPVYGPVEHPGSLLVYRDSLKSLLQKPIGLAFSGHGEEIEDVHGLIRERIKKQEERANHILSLLDKPRNAFELSRLLFPNLYIKELPLTMSETVGHLDLLVEQQRVRLVKEQGIFFFEAAKEGVSLRL